MKYTFGILALLFLFSCGENIKEKPINSYYNVDSLLNQQQKLADLEELSIKKRIGIDGEEELDTVRFDSLGWKNELEAFRIADINKPNLKGMYEAVEQKSDEQIVWKYTTEKNSLGIEFLHIYFDKANNLQKLIARYNENNALYTSERNLLMEFNPQSHMLTAYSVEGSQKMVMNEPVQFFIKSEVLAN